MYIDSLSDAQVVDELQKHHATAGKANNELSIKDARKFLTHVLRSTTTLAVTDPRFERAIKCPPHAVLGLLTRREPPKATRSLGCLLLWSTQCCSAARLLE